MYLCLYGCFNSRTREGCDLTNLCAFATTYVVSIHAPGRGATGSLGSNRRVRDVSIHAPGRGATHTNCYSNHVIMFQFTHPGGVRQTCSDIDIWGVAFQFTHPGGVRHFSGLSSRRRTLFQFTHPGGVRQTRVDPSILWVFSFNSRTREGCDVMRSLSISTIGVSIHAPGRGATCTYLRHSPIDTSFNSRTREGCDMACSLRTRLSTCFNSRTREGCDRVALLVIYIGLKFQFTHPGGVRHSVYHFVCHIRVSFNSRTREGCDSIASYCSSLCLTVSIHAPGRGATVRTVSGWTLLVKVSIHAPGRGATSPPFGRNTR